jgi:hypothetical protein
MESNATTSHFHCCEQTEIFEQNRWVWYCLIHIVTHSFALFIVICSSNPDDPDEISLKDFSDEWTEEAPETDDHIVFKDPEIGDWLLVKFPRKKTIKYYVALVESKNVDLFVRCARNIGQNNFKWADPEDCCSVDYDQIERRLEPPTFNYKNDRLVSFFFKRDFAGYTVC